MAAVAAPRARVSWRWLLKWLGSISAALLALILLLVITLYLLLRSPSLYQQLLNRFGPDIEAASGVKIHQLRSAEVDLLRGVRINGLKLEWHDPQQGDLAVEIGQLALLYQPLELLRGQLLIDQLLLQKATVSGTLSLPATTDPTPDDNPSPDLTALLESLRQPALPAVVKKSSIDTLQLDLHLQQGESKFEIVTTLKHDGDMRWQAGELRGRDQITLLGSNQQPIQLQIGGAEPLQLRFTPQLNAELAWQLQQQNGRWLLDAKLEPQTLQLDQLQLTESNADQQSQIDIQQLALSNQISLSSSDGSEPLFPLQLHQQSELKLTGIQIRQQNNGEMPSQRQVSAEQQLGLTLDNRILSPEHPIDQLKLLLTSATKGQLHQSDPHQQQRVDDLNSQFLFTLKSSGPASGSLLPPLNFEASLEGSSRLIELLALTTEPETTTQATEPATASRTSLNQPRFKLALNGNLASLEEPLKQLQLNFQHQVSLEQIERQTGQDETLLTESIQSPELNGQGHFDHGQINYSLAVKQQQANLQALKKPFSSLMHLNLNSNLDLSSAQLTSALILDQQPLLGLSLLADAPANRLTLQPTLTLFTPQSLSRLHDALKPLRQLGDQKLQLSATAQLDHQQPSLLKLSSVDPMQLPFRLDGELNLAQLTRPLDKPLLLYAKPLQLDFAIDRQQAYQSRLALSAPWVQLPGVLRRPVALDWQQQASSEWPPFQPSAEGSLKINQQPALAYRLKLQNQPKQAGLQANLELHADPKWQRYLAKLKPLDQVGKLRIKLDLDGKLDHSADTLLELDETLLKRSRWQSNQILRLSQQRSGTLLSLPREATLSQQLNWSAENAALTNRLQLPRLALKQQLAAKNLDLNLRLKAHSGLDPQQADLQLTLNGSSLTLPKNPFVDTTDTNTPTTLELAHLLFPLKLNAEANQSPTNLNLKQFKLELGNQLLGVEMSANANRNFDTGQLIGHLSAAPRANLLPQPTLGGSGRLSLPWQLTLQKGREVSLEGEMAFDKFSIDWAGSKLENVNGTLRLAEELLLTKADDNTPIGVSFRYLNHVDAFQRVDYSRIQPQLDNRQNLSIESLSVDRYQAGPLHASLGIEQNLLRLQQFDLALYGGHITGQFYLDTTPGSWKLGLLSRLSQINLQPLLAEDSAYKRIEQPPISARTALELDIKQRLLEGRIDISDISREQLLQLLELFDPDYQNEQLSPIRAGLHAGYPEWVALNMHQGMVDLEFSLSLLPGTLKVRGLPLSPILQRFAGELLSQLDTLPLQ